MKKLLIFSVLCFLLVVSACEDNKSVDQRVRDITDKRVLSSGLELWVENGAQVSQLEIRTIEGGMREKFARAIALGYNRPTTLGNYTVVIFADCVKEANGVYVYKIPAAGTPYEGGQYDHDGFIHVAGQYMDNRTDKNIIVLPDYRDDSLEILANTAGYEVEHVVLRHSNPSEYYRTKIHSALTPHPLF